jgi:uncharacterized protein YjiS (DUF1127 family)
MLVVEQRGTEMSITKSISTFVKYRRTLNELSQLGDHQLRDLGIERANLRAAAKAAVL